jgi:hypothetical protein
LALVIIFSTKAHDSNGTTRMKRRRVEKMEAIA